MIDGTETPKILQSLQNAQRDTEQRIWQSNTQFEKLKKIHISYGPLLLVVILLLQTYDHTIKNLNLFCYS